MSDFGYDANKILHYPTTNDQAICGATLESVFEPDGSVTAITDYLDLGHTSCEACLHLSGRYVFPDGTKHQTDGSCCDKHYEAA